MEKREITTQEEARQYAIDWQQWASENKMFTSELIEWQQIFEDLALNFDLLEEFKEEGIL
jgi:hypothetical protein